MKTIVSLAAGLVVVSGAALAITYRATDSETTEQPTPVKAQAEEMLVELDKPVVGKGKGRWSVGTELGLTSGCCGGCATEDGKATTCCLQDADLLVSKTSACGQQCSGKTAAACCASEAGNCNADKFTQTARQCCSSKGDASLARCKRGQGQCTDSAIECTSEKCSKEAGSASEASASD